MISNVVSNLRLRRRNAGLAGLLAGSVLSDLTDARRGRALVSCEFSVDTQVCQWVELTGFLSQCWISGI